MIAWFRSKRQLIARNTELAGLVAKQIDEIAALRDEMDADRARADEQIKHLQTSLTIGNDQVRRLTTQRDELSQQNIRVRNALQVLRDDITREERAALFGMVRPAPPRRGGLHDRPLPWQTTDAINQDATAKRQADGLGD